jgi:hypothetical protein
VGYGSGLVGAGCRDRPSCSDTGSGAEPELLRFHLPRGRSGKPQRLPLRSEWPDDDNDGIACENLPSRSSDEPSQTSPPVVTDEPGGASWREVLTQVEGRAVIAISTRTVVAAGCPGGRSIAFRIPDSALNMRNTVIIHPMEPSTDTDSTVSAATAPVTVMQDAQRAGTRAQHVRHDARHGVDRAQMASKKQGRHDHGRQKQTQRRKDRRTP